MRRFSKICLCLTLLPALLSCTKPAKGLDDANNGATFIVDTITGKGQTGKFAEKTKWNIPDYARFTFTACIKERTSRVQSRKQDFTVENPETHEQFDAQTSGEQGCFNWQEDMDYNHYAGQSGWIGIERDIIGRGVNIGRQRVKLAVNPWAIGENSRDIGSIQEVLFLRAGNDSPPIKYFEPKVAAHAFSGELQESASLIVQEATIRPIPVGESSHWVDYLVVVHMEPKVLFHNANGLKKYGDVPDGEFDVLMQVLGSNVGAEMSDKPEDKVLLLGGDLHAIAHAVDGKINVEFRVRQEGKPNQSNLELVLQLRPRNLNAYRTLLPFNGLYRLGSGNILKDKPGYVANICLEDQSKCDYNTIIKKAKNYKDLLASGYVQENSRYLFTTLRLRFNSILAGETATHRTVAYGVTTCITDSVTGEALANTPMVIRYIKDPGNDGDSMEPDEPIKTTTNNVGCLQWSGYVFHKYYMPEHFIVKNVIISKGEKTISRPGHKSLKMPRFERHMKFYLNPWDDKFTFGWDANEFTPEFFEKMTSRPKIPSRFFLGDYGFHTVRFLYNIDEFMDLEVKKWVLMGLEPRVLRYSGIANARKMVEPVRDGIYLMKVAIQKSYLDPHDNSGTTLRNNAKLQAEIVQVGPAQVPLRARDFITTSQVLVRVVDGYIVYPIELVMRDLRLMRVRSNFIIELQTVDERMVQAYYVYRKYAIQDQDLEGKLKDLKSRMLEGVGVDPATIDPTLKNQENQPDLEILKKARAVVGEAKDVTAARRALEARVEDTRTLVDKAMRKLKQQFESGKHIGEVLNSAGKPVGPANVPAGGVIDENFELNPNLLRELEQTLSINDFSRTQLPKKEEIDLNVFVENNSGLERRSFVGPVIFLSNAYGDSMRATDNLDEAGCTDPSKGADGLQKSRDELELDLKADNEINKVETKLFNHRENNAYQFNVYFSALGNLCYKQVDDLIEEEKKLNKERDDASVAASTKYNYVNYFNMDFVSLSDEPLQKVNDECVDDQHSARDCMVTTTENTLKASKLDSLINDNLGVEYGSSAFALGFDPELPETANFNPPPPLPGPSRWLPQQYGDLFFARSLPSKIGLCNLLSNRTAHLLRKQKLSRFPVQGINALINDICLRSNELIQDIKYRVIRTGDYNFLGGLNLNFNVGEGFSVGTSYSWSAGIDWVDALSSGVGLLGGRSLAGRGALSILKPLSLKNSSGMSESEGTGVSESAYLVSQIAGFKVQLTDYERCVALALPANTLEQLAVFPDNTSVGRFLGFGRGPGHFGMVDLQSEAVKKIFHRGLFVCEGKTPVPHAPTNVEEKYFYFTQHFTEGDMLDPADLYNQPWLLPLRGMREFSTFVRMIRAQEVVDLPDFANHLTGYRKPRTKGWALCHLALAYRKVLPTFPGFYTLLEPGENNVDFFSLNEARDNFSKPQPAQAKEASDAVTPAQIDADNTETQPVDAEGCKLDDPNVREAHNDVPNGWVLDPVDHDQWHEISHASVNPENAAKIEAPPAPDPKMDNEPSGDDEWDNYLKLHGGSPE